jgi:hypothetical protein
MIAYSSASCKLISPILSAMKSKDPKTNLEHGKNLVANSNIIDLTQMNLVSPTVGTNCHGL